MRAGFSTAVPRSVSNHHKRVSKLQDDDPCTSHAVEEPRPPRKGRSLAARARWGARGAALILGLTAIWQLGSFLTNSTASVYSTTSLLSKNVSCRMSMPEDPLPVYHFKDQIYYENHPVSRHRPQRQFHDCSLPVVHDNPLVVIITATQNPGEAFQATADSVYAQSLRNLRWLIIDDHSDDPVALERLSNAAQQDPRIHILPNPGEKGLAASRNVGLDAISSLRTLQAPYVVMLDDDDLLELTVLEKAVWMLESNPNWSIVSYHFVKFGYLNTTETRGLHSGAANYYSDNYIANSALIRASAIQECRYDVSFDTGGEDWDFWLCLAEAGHWGGTLPELAYWYRVNDPAFRKRRWGNTFTGKAGHRALEQHIHAKHQALHQSLSQVSAWQVSSSKQLEPARLRPPFRNNIRETARKGSILLVLPWLAVGGADIGAVRMLEMLASEGYRVTVVCTLHTPPASVELRPLALQWTHDVHILPAFLRAADMPSYITYLAESRNAHTVFFSNSMLLYDLLPMLRETLPRVAFIDYLHNESEGWKSGGYARYSILYQRFLDHTIASSHYLKDWLVSKGHSASRIGVVKLGVDLESSQPDSDLSPPGEVRKSLHSADRPTIVRLLSVARVDRQKRPLLLPGIIEALVQDYDYVCGPSQRPEQKSILMTVVGNGPLERELKAAIGERQLDECFHLAGLQGDTSSYYHSADLFLLPSSHEGLSVAVSEAMAAGLPIVATHVAALPEQIGLRHDPSRAGSLVKSSSNESLPSAADYASEVHRLLQNDAEMHQLGQNGIKRTRHSDWHDTLRSLFPELVRGSKARKAGRSQAELALLPHPASEMAIQIQLHEFRDAFDLQQSQKRLLRH